MSEITNSPAEPLVSVIIPSYNHARYIGRAIQSVLAQTGADWEIVVVDDGSIDDTRAVVAKYPEATYVYQKNQGLSAARNTGTGVSRGTLLVFLDADDRLLPGALEAGMCSCAANPDAGFVSGRHVRVDPSGETIAREENPQPDSDHYLALLRGNYIGMHATVMYRRDILQAAGGFDVRLPACEDYDLYLRIARDFPVSIHHQMVAEYWIHDSNMSNDVGLMLATVLGVLLKQRPHTSDDPRRKLALEEGISIWKKYYSHEMITQFNHGANPKASTLALISTLGRHAPWELVSFLKRGIRGKARSVAGRILPPWARQGIRRILGRGYTPSVGRVGFGDFRRLRPISRCFGFDRGLPIDRHYIERFLSREGNLVRGRVLEIGDNEYTLRCGGNRVTRSEILHAVEGNPNATYVGDLTQADHIPSNAFDCIILTQTLHLIYDMRAAVKTLHRILKPGGVLLATVPGISQIEDGVWASVWYWSLTKLSARRLLEEAFPSAAVEVEAHGNVLTSIAFLQGLATEELRPDELAHHDPLYPMVITMIATKPLS